MSRLAPDIIDQIRRSTDPVIDTARRFNVSVATVSRHRPVGRPNLTGAECDLILADWISGVPVHDTAARLRVSRHTVYRVRRDSTQDLIEGSRDE